MCNTVGSLGHTLAYVLQACILQALFVWTVKSLMRPVAIVLHACPLVKLVMQRMLWQAFAVKPHHPSDAYLKRCLSAASSITMHALEIFWCLRRHVVHVHLHSLTKQIRAYVDSLYCQRVKTASALESTPPVSVTDGMNVCV